MGNFRWKTEKIGEYLTKSKIVTEWMEEFLHFYWMYIDGQFCCVGTSIIDFCGKKTVATPKTSHISQFKFTNLGGFRLDSRFFFRLGKTRTSLMSYTFDNFNQNVFHYIHAEQFWVFISIYQPFKVQYYFYQIANKMI